MSDPQEGQVQMLRLVALVELLIFRLLDIKDQSFLEQLTELAQNSRLHKS